MPPRLLYAYGSSWQDDGTAKYEALGQWSGTIRASRASNESDKEITVWLVSASVG